ncbi:MAG: hypothetical protein P8X57_05900, partial [Cyclobacteriaceae bacterium]
MSKQKFNKIVRDFHNLTETDRQKLEELGSEYPYSQVIHILIAKAHHDAGTSNAKTALHHAAMYATDRSILRDLLESASDEAASKSVHDDLMSDLEKLMQQKAEFSTVAAATEDKKPEAKKSTAAAKKTGTRKKSTARKTTSSKSGSAGTAAKKTTAKSSSKSTTAKSTAAKKTTT